MKAREKNHHTGRHLAGGLTSKQIATAPTSEGQAGDLQGLSDAQEADSESVGELAAEGQSYEAGVLEGVENASDSDIAPVKTREVPEDDVPAEYLEDNE